MKDDTISRAAAIDAVNNMIRRQFGISADLGTGALLELPSATDTNVGGNLIDRQAALDAIKKLEKPATTAQHLSAIFDCEDTIKALPSAQTERKKGKWIERNPLNSPDCRLIECSECGNAYIVGYNINYDNWIDGRNFCMKCGADLRGGSNGKST